jgi:hypothetical protein
LTQDGEVKLFAIIIIIIIIIIIGSTALGGPCPPLAIIIVY